MGTRTAEMVSSEEFLLLAGRRDLILESLAMLSFLLSGESIVLKSKDLEENRRWCRELTTFNWLNIIWKIILLHVQEVLTHFI